MELKTTNILKSSQVRFEGNFHLDLTNHKREQKQKCSGPLSNPQLKIIEKNQNFAMIEITCGCGEKILVKCHYSPQNQPPVQADEKKINDEPKNTQ
jgi:hypothetical protein